MKISGPVGSTLAPLVLHAQQYVHGMLWCCRRVCTQTRTLLNRPSGMHAACNMLIGFSPARQVWLHLAEGDRVTALQSLAHSMAMYCRQRPMRGRPASIT